MALSTNDLLNYAYYRCLPQIYRDKDSELGMPLFRYLSSIILYGYRDSIEDIEGIITIIDPENCPEEYFPLLYSCFGLDYYPDVGVIYHRKILMNYGELRRRRGTYSCVRFLVKVLTGLEVNLSYFRGYHDEVYGRYLEVKLQVKTLEELENMDNSMALVSNFLGLFIPYYITTLVSGEIAVQEVKNEAYRANAISSFYSYSIRPSIGGE